MGVADSWTLGVPSGGTAYIGAAVHEDLLDVITLLSPTDTPLFTMSRKTKVKNAEVSWLVDNLQTASSNAAIEGSTAAFNAITARTRLTNYVQTSRHAYEVTDTMRAVDPAGVQDEFLYQMGKAAKQWKRDVEYEMVNQSAASGTSAIARSIRGIYNWLVLTAGASGNSTGVTGSNTANLIQEADFNARLQALWVNGGMADYVVCTPNTKGQVSSNFSGSANSRRNIPMTENTVMNVIDYYFSDFGNVKLLPHRWFSSAAPTGSVNIQRATFFLQSDTWMIGILRPPKNVPLAKLGSSERAMIEGDWTLICRHPSANAALTGHASGTGPNFSTS